MVRVRLVGLGRRSGTRRRRTMVAASAWAMAVLAAACSSTQASTTPSTTAGGTAAIPKSAFSDRTGLTATTVRIGNVSTLLGGLFKGAQVGTQAYAAYVNSQGGVNGRKLVVDLGNDNYSGAPNRQLTQQDIGDDFAMVGSFSLQDSYGGAVLARNPQVPNVTVNLDSATAALPNSFSPDPDARRLAARPARLLPEKVPGSGARHRRPHRRPAVGRDQVGRREGSHGASRLPSGLTTRPSTSPPPTSTSTWSRCATPG